MDLRDEFLPEAEAVRQLFSKWRLERVVVKNAAQGSTYYDRAQSIHVSSFKVVKFQQRYEKRHGSLPKPLSSKRLCPRGSPQLQESFKQPILGA